MGPRGVTSIVFGSLAIIDVPERYDDVIAKVMVMTVLLSIVLHGLSSEPIARLYARPAGSGVARWKRPPESS